MFSSLLLPLVDLNSTVRMVAFQFLCCLYDNISLSSNIREIYATSPVLHLLKYIVNYGVELIADYDGLKVALEKFFDVTDVSVFQNETYDNVQLEAVLDEIMQSLLMMIGIETPPYFMIFQLLKILTGVDCKVMY